MFKSGNYLWVVIASVLLLNACAGSGSAQKSSDEAKEKKKSYAKMIAEMDTDEGLFDVHLSDEKLFYTIPDDLLDEPMLMISRIAQTPVDLNPYIPAGSKTAEQVLRWQKKGDRILLRRVSYEEVASDSLPISKSVKVNNFEPIIMSFDIEGRTPDSTGSLIEVTKLFTEDVPVISGLFPSQRREFQVRRLDGDRSYIDTVKSFPKNVNVRHTLTFDAGNPPADDGTGTISMQMYQSMVLLPQDPMMPRLADHRVGYFDVDRINYGSNEQKAAEETFISRWRLVPKDVEAYLRGELVEPVDPIIYYLDPATPEKWRPYFIKGVEDWQKAFEAAGFKNAIICKLPPKNDPDFDPEDVRYSTVRYVATTTRNAIGPSVSDPRTGEILESDIIWFHNHIRSYRNRLMIETGASNPAARSLQIDEELIGETMRQVIAHEIGHALGLPHNMIASSAYPVDSLRSASFARKMGVAPTIMDYARQNYIAQPQDNLDPKSFIRQIGPYDLYAIEWGYRWYPNVDSPEDENEMLNQLILEHADDPMYRFGGRVSYNPESQTEDLGDDPVKASGYGVENLKRVVPNLFEWTYREGKDYSDLEELYGELQYQWYRYMNHVITNIGGVFENRKTYNQEGPVYSVVPRDEQERALTFMSEQVFETPDWMLEDEILRRIEPAGAVNRLSNYQARLLGNMLNPPRLQRLIEAETIDGENAYPLNEYLSDLTGEVWSELDNRSPEITTFRRNLQRAYLGEMEGLMMEDFDVDLSWYFGTGVNVDRSDIRSVVRGALNELKSELEQKTGDGTNSITNQHINDAIARIDDILEKD